MRVFKATGLRYRINIVSGGGGGLHFKWCQGEAAGVGNLYKCVVFQLLLAGIVVVSCDWEKKPFP